VHDNTWHQALQKTRQTTLGRITQLLGRSEIKDDFWSELETVFIQADIGLSTTQKLLEFSQRKVQEQGFTRGEQVQSALRQYLIAELGDAPDPQVSSGTRVTILVGVNGTGKTTSAAKLAYRLVQQQKTVLLAAADTYRAAAAEQLRTWGEQLAIDVIWGAAGSDPGAVVYDACQAAVARHCDHLIVDTSGRMHTEHNLMAELQKLCRVSTKLIEGAPHAILLVLDAASGQNGLAQAKAFAEIVPVTGTILAKLDGSAKGGIALAIREALDLPVIYVGVGERREDLLAFEAEAYVSNLLLCDK
jgi:fused signal recognition particle receptor